MRYVCVHFNGSLITCKHEKNAPRGPEPRAKSLTPVCLTAHDICLLFNIYSLHTGLHIIEFGACYVCIMSVCTGRLTAVKLK